MRNFAAPIGWLNVGNVSLIYVPGIQNLCRGYIKGFTAQAAVTNMAIVGTVLEFDYAPASLHWGLQINPAFFAPSSNYYTTDYVFDLANSYSFVGVVPTPTTIAFGIQFIPGEGAFRLGTNPGGIGDLLNAADLPALGDYWLPV